MRKINEKVKKTLKLCDISTRPNAEPGIWLMPLLPTAVILSIVRHPTESTYIYKLSGVLSFGFLLNALIFTTKCIRGKDILKVKSLYLLPGAVVATVLNVIFQRNFFASFISGFMSGMGYHKLFVFILKKFPFSFTIGEAAIVAQGVILFLHSAVENIIMATHKAPYKVLDVATLILQVSLLTLGIICLLSYTFTIFRRPVPFYMMFFSSIIFFLVIPIHIILQRNPILWILSLVVKNVNTLNMFLYWSVCSVIAVIAIRQRISEAKKASTIVRKVFHLLAIAAFVPGLLYECTLLYISSVIILGFFIALELMRVLNMPPVGQILQDGFMIFCDEKDAGTIALTPIYLLVGCSLPIWIHPAPCDLTDSVGYYLLPLISGLLSIGVGDTAASVVGTFIGKHKWPGTKKTVEGTISCVVSQVFMIFILVYLGLILRGHMQIIKSGIAIIITSLIEAKTTQIDNLVLPLVMYLLLV